MCHRGNPCARQGERARRARGQGAGALRRAPGACRDRETERGIVARPGAGDHPRVARRHRRLCGTMRTMASDLKALEGAHALRNRVIRTIRDHEAELRALGVEKLWLFGSLARGDVGRRSDVDVLISVPPAQRFSLLDLAGVRVELCELLGRDTDVVIREDVLLRFWETIEDDLVEVF